MEPISVGSSTVKAGITAYKNRHLIYRVWTLAKVTAGLGNTEIVFTGRAGVGKTLLADAIEGRALKRGYSFAGESKTTETSAVEFGERTRLVRVLPGQESRRTNDAERTFSQNTSLQGIIHVVDFGFTGFRNEVISQQMISSGIDTIAKLRTVNLGEDVLDFMKLASDVRRALNKNRKRRLWLVIAVNKVDLFPSERTDAKLAYHPDGTSQFSKKLAELVRDLGSDRLHVEVLDVCGHEENFQFNGKVRPTKLAANKKEAIMNEFVARLTQLVEDFA
jgi:hypothetical protein